MIFQQDFWLFLSLACSEILFAKYAKISLCGKPAGDEARRSHGDAPIPCMWGESLPIFPVNDSATQGVGVTTCCGPDLLDGISQKPPFCKVFGQSGLADDRRSELGGPGNASAAGPHLQPCYWHSDGTLKGEDCKPGGYTLLQEPLQVVDCGCWAHVAPFFVHFPVQGTELCRVCQSFLSVQHMTLRCHGKLGHAFLIGVVHPSAFQLLA